MLSLSAVEQRIRELAERIGAPDWVLPTFGYSEGSGRPHIEQNGAGFDYVVSERGQENSRRMAVDLDQLLEWVFRDVTFSMACSYEISHRAFGPDPRRLIFAHQLELLRQLSSHWADLELQEHQSILARYPFADGG